VPILILSGVCILSNPKINIAKERIIPLKRKIHAFITDIKLV